MSYRNNGKTREDHSLGLRNPDRMAYACAMANAGAYACYGYTTDISCMEADTKSGIIRKIILCVDGETQTEKAVNYAIDITRACNGTLTALHVINPYLKKFADEIYAVGRIEYRKYIEKELMKEAEKIMNGFRAVADSAGLSYDLKVRYGPPEEEIMKEVSENSYDLLVLGAKQNNTLYARISSFNLPGKIFDNLRIPTLFVQ
jgi:nucleotide-binding universal stress UspA family protein